MSSLGESLICSIVKFFGAIVSRLPLRVAAALGRFIGSVGYHIDTRHRAIAYGNLKIAFEKTKKPREIKRITKELFQNFGQNLIEVYQLPVMHRLGPEKFVAIEGKEYLTDALKQKKGAIILAMHFGSWELTNFVSTLLGYPYNVIVKAQTRFSKLDDLLNSYRQCGGATVLARGRGTREIVESLRRNEIVGIVVDQGGRDGALVKFFGRHASMSVGAIRMGLKLGVPICFAVLVRDSRTHHRMVIHQPLKLINTGNAEKDIRANIENVVTIMEEHIRQHPSEYMWFYKIWKYSNEARIIILNDGKAGHLRQSQTVAKWIVAALAERNIASQVKTIDAVFLNMFAQRIVKVFGLLSPARFPQGRLSFLKYFLARKSYLDCVTSQGDFVVSCGSSVAGLNFLLSQENRAKSIAILRPSFLPLSRFHLTVLPRHDLRAPDTVPARCVVTDAAPNLITGEYLKEQAALLIRRYSHLKETTKKKIGVLLGGNTKDNILSDMQVKVLIAQLKEAAEAIDADILVTTSRRSSPQAEQMLQRDLKSFERCRLLIIANRNNIPEAVGGILGLSDIVVVSGDSISMVSEAASAGKKTVVFPVQEKKKAIRIKKNKHKRFIEQLHANGYIVACEERAVGRVVCDMAKNKITTKPLDDNRIILEAMRHVI